MVVKIGTIPTSIILGIAGLNTYWGNRKILIESNKYFGNLNIQLDDALINAKSMSTKYQSFNSIESAIRGLYATLNTNKNFENFRNQRQINPTANEALINTLAPLILYNENFTKNLASTIKNNNLTSYDYNLNLVQPTACLKFS